MAALLIVNYDTTDRSASRPTAPPPLPHWPIQTKAH